MKKSEIIFWLTMFFSFSVLIGYIVGIKRTFTIWVMVLLFWVLMEMTFQYRKMLQKRFD